MGWEVPLQVQLLLGVRKLLECYRLHSQFGGIGGAGDWTCGMGGETSGGFWSRCSTSLPEVDGRLRAFRRKRNCGGLTCLVFGTDQRFLGSFGVPEPHWRLDLLATSGLHAAVFIYLRSRLLRQDLASSGRGRRALNRRLHFSCGSATDSLQLLVGHVGRTCRCRAGNCWRALDSHIICGARSFLNWRCLAFWCLLRERG